MCEAFVRHYLAVTGDAAQLVSRLRITEPLCCMDGQERDTDERRTAAKMARFMIQNAASMTPEGLMRASLADVYLWTSFPKAPSEMVRSAAARLANSCRLAMNNATCCREKQCAMSAEEWGQTRALATLMLHRTT